MGIELDKAASYHVRISSLRVRLKCDVGGCWNLGRAAMEFADDVGRPVEHRVVCNQHTRDEIEKVKGVASLTIHDERAGKR
jgi:hypothetical protein